MERARGSTRAQGRKDEDMSGTQGVMRWVGAVIGACMAVTASAAVRLPSVVDSHMVLQRDKAISIWGWADPGEDVIVTLDDRKVWTGRAQADSDGRWQVFLPPIAAGGPYTMTVQGANTITLTDILIGELWVCSGQSNMEMGLGVVKDGEKERAAADYPKIRLFELPQVAAGEPRDDIDAHWRLCHPDNIAEGRWGGFSAVGYFFGRELHRELGVPIGLIDASWGGTRIEPWTPPCGFEPIPTVRHFADEIREKDAEYKANLPGKLEEIERWIAATRAALAEKKRLPISPWWPRHPLESHAEPSGLYNGMIHPLTPLVIRGVIWYQGESNVHSRDRMLYFDKMRALIDGWQKVWREGGPMPFYYVQIAPFQYHWHNPALKPYEVPLLWEAQTLALRIPNTGMVVTTDIGDLRDIHPANKQEVGRRLALCALARTYGREGLVCSGPLYKSRKVEGSRIRLSFNYVGSGLASRDGKPLDWFQIAGEDMQFVEAQARIDGNTVLVWSDDVPAPRYVRFGWHQEAEPNLMNAEGLPASPFRTDQFAYPAD